ncbi:hypothetical protein PG997_010462 [Apiospora hydei]|uniref:Uncharacterized protein n=1 Tax=Apiospora hydei TaxID=1337664 RepID=A0ABR1W0U0_9PEZI
MSTKRKPDASNTISSDQTAASDFERQRLFILHDPLLTGQNPKADEQPVRTGRQTPPLSVPTSLPDWTTREDTRTESDDSISLDEEYVGEVRDVPHLSGMDDVAHEIGSPGDEGLSVALQPTAKDPSLKNRIHELELELARLRKSLSGENNKPPTFQTFHLLEGDPTRFLAEPSWRVDGANTYLKGNVPLSEPYIYLQELGNIAFVVYKEYASDSSPDAILSEVAHEKAKSLANPKPVSHFIELYSPPHEGGSECFLQ